MGYIAALSSVIGKKFVVTGGAGMVGSFIVDKLLETGASKIVVLDNLSKGSAKNIASDSRIEFHKVNIGHEDITKYFEGIDFVFHQSAHRITKCSENPQEAIVSMGLGALHVWEAARINNIKKIILASSASVYGQADSFPTRVDHHLNNCNTLYGGLKILNECLARSYNIPHVSLRYHNVYGPRMDGNGKYSEVFIRWYDNIKCGGTPEVYGDGTLDLVFCKDIAMANIIALIMPTGTYNVCSGKYVSLGQLCDKLGNEMKSRGFQYAGYKKREVVNPPFRWGYLGEFNTHWGPLTSLESGLKQFVDYMELQDVKMIDSCQIDPIKTGE